MGLLLGLACLLRLNFRGCLRLLQSLLYRILRLVRLCLRSFFAVLNLFCRLRRLLAELAGRGSGDTASGVGTRFLHFGTGGYIDVLHYGCKYVLARGDDGDGYIRCRRLFGRRSVTRPRSATGQG